jgi:hypothetical protein
MQASEPGDVQTTKLTEAISTSLWDRWDIEACGASLKELIQMVETKYEGLEVRDVLRGNAPVYFHAIMNAAGKEKDKERTMNAKLAELLDITKEDEPYVDLTLTCTRSGEDKLLDGVPPLRVTLFKK